MENNLGSAEPGNENKSRLGKYLSTFQVVTAKLLILIKPL